MATLTYNASFANSARIATIAASTSGALSGKVALLIDNTATRADVQRLLAGLIRRFDRDQSKAVKISEVATSGSTLE